MAAWTYKVELAYTEWRFKRVLRSKAYKQALMDKDWDTCDALLNHLFDRILDIQRVQKLRESGL